MSEEGAIRALGLDPSMTATGWAVGCDDGTRPVWGVHRAPSWGEEEGPQLARFSDFLNATIDRYRVTHCYYEKTYFDRASNFASQRSKIMLEAPINEICHRRGVEVADVPINSWRWNFIGTAKAPKHVRIDEGQRAWFKGQAVAECARREWYLEDHNAAEALAIMVYGLCESPRYRHRNGPEARRAATRSEAA